MRQVRWSSIRLTTFLWQAVLVLEDLLYSSGHIPSWCSTAFPNVGTKAWSAQPSIFSPICFFCFFPMDFALNTTKKGFRKTSTDGWMTAHWNIHCGQGLERRKPSVTIVLDSAEVLSQTIRTTLWWALRNYDIFQHLIYILLFVDKQKLNKHSCSACFRSKSVRNKGAFEHTLVPHVLGKPCRRLNIETGHQGTEGSQSVRRGRFCKRTYRSRTSSSSCVCAKVPQNLPHLEKHVPFLKKN